MKPEIEIILEDDKLELLRRFCEYAVMFYIPYFLTANFGADAAVNDLSLYKKLKKFSQVDKLLAEEALATLSRHLWYLSPSTVLFSLASKKLEDGTMTSRALQPGFYLCQNQTISNWDIQTFRSCLTKLSCGTWSPGNCSTL